MDKPTLEPFQTLARNLRCAICGAQRTRAAEQVYRLVAIDDTTLCVAALVCAECGSVRLFLLE